MASFTGANMEANFAATDIDCLTQVTWNATADVASQACSGSTYKRKAVGKTDATFVLNFLIDNVTDVTQIPTTLAIGASGAFEFHPEGDTTGNLEFVAATAIVSAVDIDSPVDGFVTGTATIEVDGALTIQAAV